MLIPFRRPSNSIIDQSLFQTATVVTIGSWLHLKDISVNISAFLSFLSDILWSTFKGLKQCKQRHTLPMVMSYRINIMGGRHSYVVSSMPSIL